MKKITVVDDSKKNLICPYTLGTNRVCVKKKCALWVDVEVEEYNGVLYDKKVYVACAKKVLALKNNPLT